MEWINYFGLAMAFGAVLGVVIHAASRPPRLMSLVGELTSMTIKKCSGKEYL